MPAVFDLEDLIGLSGALAHSKVSVRFTGLFISLDVEHFAVRKMWRDLFFDIDRDCWVIYNRKFRIHKDYWGQDLAGRSIAAQARAAQRVGVGRILTHAVGNFHLANHVVEDERWSGYWVWPRIGLDAEIPAAIRPRLSADFQGYKRLSELVATERGEAEWYLHGDSVHVEFDLAAGSASWQTLERYTTKRGARGMTMATDLTKLEQFLRPTTADEVRRARLNAEQEPDEPGFVLALEAEMRDEFLACAHAVARVQAADEAQRLAAA